MLIKKDDFVSILNFLKERRVDWDNLQTALEKLSPDNYVNFWPYLEYEDKINNLLNCIFNFNSDWSPITYYMIEGNYGLDNIEYLKEYSVDNITGDITTPENLYNYCITLYDNLK